MKILYVNEFLNSSSGARVHSRKLVRELKKIGVSVITVPAYRDEEEIDKESGSAQNFKDMLPVNINETAILLKKTLRSLLWLFKIISAAKKEKPDCVLIRPGLYDILPVWIKGTLKLPLILEINAPLYAERKMLYRMRGKPGNLSVMFNVFEIMAWKNADAIYVVSAALKNMIESRLKETSSKIKVIPNGVDLDNFDKLQASDVSRRPDLTNICFVGSFHPWHGIDLLIDAFKDVCAQTSLARLIIIGDGLNRKQMELKARLDNLEDKVIFTGRLSNDETVRRLKSMDILAAPYCFVENFYYSPIKIFEYMASGKAIVASDIGQISEVIEDGKDALLVKPESKTELVQALLKLIGSKDLRVKLGSNALQKSKNYTWEKTAKELLDLAEQITSK